jgi:tRNA(fMet)-specific endonuclease VapC
MAKRSVSRERRSAIEGLFALLEVLAWGTEEAAAYGRSRAKLEAQGTTVALMDMLIAAQAIAAGAILVTRDRVFAQVDDLRATVDWATDLAGS